MLIIFESVHVKAEIERNTVMLIIFESVHVKAEIERNTIMLIKPLESVFKRVLCAIGTL